MSSLDEKTNARPDVSREDLLEQVISSVADICFIVDHHGTFLECWAGREDLLLQPPHKLIGRKIREFLANDVSQRIQGAIDHCAQEKKSTSVEYSLEVGGSERFFEAVLSPLANDTVVAKINDITDLVDAEKEELAAARRHSIQQQTIVSLAKHSQVVSGNIPDAFAVVAEEAARAIRTARVGVWLFGEGNERLRCKALFADNATSTNVDLALAADDYPAYFSVLEKQRVVDAHNARFDPRTTDFYESYLAPLGITSMLDASIRVAGKTVGVVCFEHVGPSRIWTSDEVAFAGEIADQIAQILLNRETLLAREALEEAYAVLERRINERTRELSESESRFREVVENINEIFWTTDPEKNEMVFISPGYESIWGKSIDSLYENPRSFVESIHEEDRARVIKAFEKQVLGTYDETYRIIRPDGAVRWIHDRAFPVRDADGKVVRITGIATDITDYTEARNKLAESELFLSTILNHIPINIFVKDAENLSFILVNKAEEELTGYPLSEKIGKTDFDFFPNEQASFFQHKDREVLNQKQIVEIPEEPITNRTGDHRILRTTKIPILGKDGEPSFLLGISEDITEKKESELFLSSIIENLPILVSVKDAESKAYVRINKAFESSFAVAREQVLGKTDGEIFPERIARTLSRGDKETLATLAPYQNPALEVPLGIASNRAYKITKIPLYFGDRLPSYIISLAEDVTLEKKVEKTIRRSERLASIGTLAAGIAHEINNPLGLIQLEAESLIANAQPQSGATDALCRIRDHVKRCGAIVRNILLFSREERSEKRNADFNEIVNQGMQFVERHAEKHGVELQTLLCEEEAPIHGNRIELEQLVINLINNAIHACEKKGNVVVRTSVDKEHVSFVVADTGTGMTETEMERALDPFFTTRQHFGGTGLGLSICHGIVSDHNGKLDLTSTLNKGTTVSVQLPREAS